MKITARYGTSVGRFLVALIFLGACAPVATVTTPTPTANVTPTVSPTTTPPPTPSPTAGLMPLFDAHLHYSAPAWSAYPPGTVAKILELGPYRNVADVFSWARDPSIVPYVESMYRPGVHRGFGEFHLLPGQTALPTVRALLALAQREKLFLQPHADAHALAELLSDMPDAIVLWAHAGVDATPQQIGTLLDKWPKLSVELSLRVDIAPNGTLDQRWRDLLVRYSGRFMIGTDTWTAGGTFTGNERWDAYAQIVNGIRGWLAQLPTDVAEAIAYRNAERFLAELPR